MLCVCCDGYLDPMGPRCDHGMPKKTGGKNMQLVGGLEHDFYVLLWLSNIGKNHPNWRSHIFQRGRSTTNQAVSMRELLGVPLLPITIVAVQLQSVSVGLGHLPWLFHCGKKTQPGNWSYVLKHIEKDGYFFGCFVSPFLAKIGFLFPCFFAFLFLVFLLFCFLLLLCFFASLYICFFAFVFSAVLPFPASLLFCFFASPLFCFSAVFCFFFYFSSRKKKHKMQNQRKFEGLTSVLRMAMDVQWLL